MTSGRKTTCGNGLLGALAHFGLVGAVDKISKDEMRQMAQRGGVFSDQKRAELLNYCQKDVDNLIQLLRVMITAIEAPWTLSPHDQPKAFGQALQRGEYLKAVASMERRGVPIDVTTLNRLRASWQSIEHSLIARIDGDFGVYVGDHFNGKAFENYLTRNAITWPRSPTGRLQLDRDTFKDMAGAYPSLAPLHELRATLAQMRDWRLTVGGDRRNRFLLSPFGAKTGRNTPSTTEFIFGLATWLRSLIRPEPGMALAYLDYEQQEFGIAAALSGDNNMMDAYRSGDPYLSFAKQAGAVPPMATKDTHGTERDQFKTCVLGVQYAMGAITLADRLGTAASRARELLNLHRKTYPDYWRWSEACVAHAKLHGHLTATFGWRVHDSPDARPTSLRNFLLQANGAEMLRLACILAYERGLPICCPIHDALLVEAPLDAINEVVSRTREAMRDASELVLPSFPLRAEAKVYRWPERFSDKRGRKMWEMVQALLSGGETTA